MLANYPFLGSDYIALAQIAVEPQSMIASHHFEPNRQILWLVPKSSKRVFINILISKCGYTSSQCFPCAVDKEEALSIVCLIIAYSTMTNTWHLLDIYPTLVLNFLYYCFSPSRHFSYTLYTSLCWPSAQLNLPVEKLIQLKKALSKRFVHRMALQRTSRETHSQKGSRERLTFWYKIFYFMTLFTYALQNFFTDAEREYTIQTQYNPVHLPTGFLSIVST